MSTFQHYSEFYMGENHSQFCPAKDMFQYAICNFLLHKSMSDSVLLIHYIRNKRLMLPTWQLIKAIIISPDSLSLATIDHRHHLEASYHVN